MTKRYNREKRVYLRSKKEKWVCKPGSVLRRVTIIHLDIHRCIPQATYPETPASSRLSLSKLNNVVSLFGLAPDWVFTATFVTKCAVRSYRTISTLPVLASEPSAVYFLLHCPSALTAQPLAGILLYGARTFLQGINTSAIVRPTLSCVYYPKATQKAR
ncbi:MAG: hypothetical protein ISEC1_P0626 [Thiomicrorhabdus sp.]|nr:MAG: hypothetical protein ISEC1_P0626 [Thiomicrorhabdus sp.]